MISNINLLNTQLGNALTGTSNCDGNSSSSEAFNMVMISLLRAVAQTNAQTNVQNVATNVNNNTCCHCNCGEKNENLSLDTINSSQNSSKIRPTNEDESVNVRIENAIKTSSQKYGVDENLIRAIIKVESNFNPNVESHAGAKGLMQLMPFNCEDLGVTDPFNIEQNIDGGTRHIKEYLDKYDGDVQMALMAYNGGPTRMANRGVKSIDDIYKMPKETQNYVPKVMKYYNGQ